LYITSFDVTGVPFDVTKKLLKAQADGFKVEFLDAKTVDDMFISAAIMVGKGESVSIVATDITVPEMLKELVTVIDLKAPKTTRSRAKSATKQTTTRKRRSRKAETSIDTDTVAKPVTEDIVEENVTEEVTEKPKRKRRTKEEMAGINVAEVKPEEETMDILSRIGQIVTITPEDLEEPFDRAFLLKQVVDFVSSIRDERELRNALVYSHKKGKCDEFVNQVMDNLGTIKEIVASYK